MNNLLILQNNLGYTFKNKALLQQALTHRSYSQDHYERLEFVGDAIFNFVVAEWLFRFYPQASEGYLTRLRAHLVCQNSLVNIAEKISLGEYLRLGEGEMKSGGKNRPSILADAVEAIFAAIYLDADFLICQAVIEKHFVPLSKTLANSELSLKDPKSRLQELLQGQSQPLPDYQMLSQGKNINDIFTVRCTVIGQISQGEGRSRKIAEQQAAEKMLEILAKSNLLKY